MSDSSPDLLIKFHDGFTIERGDFKGNATAVQAHRVLKFAEGESVTISWTVAFYDPYTTGYKGTRKFKTMNGMVKSIAKHCATMGMDFYKLEQVTNLTSIMIDNPNCTEAEAREKYATGYTHDLVNTFYLNGSCHVEDGIWLTRCNHCDKAVAHWGTMQTWMSIGQHMVDVHGAQVAGINAGMLP